MAGPIEIIITQGGAGGASYSSPTLNAFYGGLGDSAVAGTGRGSQLRGEGQLLGKELGAKSNAATTAMAVMAIKVTQEAFNLGAQIMKNKVSLQAQLSGDYVAANNAQWTIDVATSAMNKVFRAGIFVAGGATIGSLIPGLGTAAGATAGAIAFGATEVIDISRKVIQSIYNLQSTLNNYQIMQTQMYADQERAGMPIYSGSRNTRY